MKIQKYAILICQNTVIRKYFNWAVLFFIHFVAKLLWISCQYIFHCGEWVLWAILLLWHERWDQTHTHTWNKVHPFRGLHGLKTEARTRPVPEIVWPNPTRPDPSGTVQFRARTRPEIPPPPPPTNSQLKKKEKGCISRLHAKKQINQGSAISQTFTSYDSLWTSGAAVAFILPSLWILYEDNSSTVQIMVIFCQLRLVSILSTLNQT